MSNDSEHHESHLFLSFASANREAVISLKGLLEHKGFSVWMDQERIGIGDFWRHLALGLLHTRCYMLVMSPQSLQSRNVLKEAQYAEYLGLSQIVVYLDSEFAELKPLMSPAFGILFGSVQGFRFNSADTMLPLPLRKALSVEFDAQLKLPEPLSKTLDELISDHINCEGFHWAGNEQKLAVQAALWWKRVSGVFICWNSRLVLIGNAMWLEGGIYVTPSSVVRMLTKASANGIEAFIFGKNGKELLTPDKVQVRFSTRVEPIPSVSHDNSYSLIGFQFTPESHGFQIHLRSAHEAIEADCLSSDLYLSPWIGGIALSHAGEFQGIVTQIAEHDSSLRTTVVKLGYPERFG